MLVNAFNMIRNNFRYSKRQPKNDEWFHPYRKCQQNTTTRNGISSITQEVHSNRNVPENHPKHRQYIKKPSLLITRHRTVKPLSSIRKKQPVSIPLKMAVSDIVNCRTFNIEENSAPQMYFQRRRTIPVHLAQGNYQIFSEHKAAEISFHSQFNSVNERQKAESQIGTEDEKEDSDDGDMFQLTPPDNSLYDDEKVCGTPGRKMTVDRPRLPLPSTCATEKNQHRTSYDDEMDSKHCGSNSSRGKFMTSEDFLSGFRLPRSYSESSSPSPSISSLISDCTTDGSVKQNDIAFNMPARKPQTENQIKVMNAFEMFSLNDSIHQSAPPPSLKLSNEDNYRYRTSVADEENRYCTKKDISDNNGRNRKSVNTSSSSYDVRRTNQVIHVKDEVDDGEAASGNSEELQEIFLRSPRSNGDQNAVDSKNMTQERRVPEIKVPYLTFPEEE